jgi:immunoglobulin-binding protein 1
MSKVPTSTPTPTPTPPAQSGSDQNKPEGMLELFEKALSCIGSSPSDSVAILTSLQHDIAARSLFSSNESVDDISSRSLSLLTLEHYLAVSYCSLSVPRDQIADRQKHIQSACDLWVSFLHRLEQLELLSDDDQEQYRTLMEISDREHAATTLPPPANRNVKIARFRVKQEAEQERQRLQSLLQRRGRLGVSADDEMDGHDEDSLERTVALTTVQIAKSEALEEWSSALRELPMIAMMVKAQEDRQGRDRYHGKLMDTREREREPSSASASSSSAPSGPLKLTHITQNGMTGELHIRKEELQSQVFRAGWNQPTMSLEELGDREVAAAMERDEKQKVAEAGNKLKPRRYEQLIKDEMEDDADLVDASAALDRQWDEFRDANPRGSGNKRGDVGDRNF